MLAWVFLLGLGIGVEPSPTNPEPAVSWMWVVDAFGFVWAGMLVATLVGLMTRQRWSLPLSLGTAAGLMAFTFACPATGHHSTTAGWWYIQIACGLALVAMSVAGILRNRSRSI
jgi:hypothetical protein